MSIPDPIVLLDARARYVHPAFQMSRASTKTVFDSSGRLVTVPPNAIGWDHYPATGQARGYLAEPPATNLLLHSNDLTQGAWLTYATSVTGDAITGPDGNGMDKIVASAVNDIHHVRQVISHSSAGTVSCSFLCAPGEFTGVFSEIIQTENNVYIWYTLEGDGDATVQNGSPVDYGITRVGDFYRVWFVFETADNDNTFRIGLLSGGSRNFAGDGTSGAYVGCVQAEAGAYPTSYIETGGATATRPADSLTMTDLSVIPEWNTAGGTFVVQHSPIGWIPNGNIFAVGNNLRFVMGPVADVRNLMGGMLDGVIRVIPAALTDAKRRRSVAFGWDNEAIFATHDGNPPSTANAISTMTGNPYLCMGLLPENARPVGAWIDRAVYYPQRISNADLQSLTAIQE